MGFLIGFPIFCIVMWFWIRGNAFVAFSLGLFLAFFGSSWRWWLDPSQYAQAGRGAMAAGAATAFAITYTPWMSGASFGRCARHPYSVARRR